MKLLLTIRRALHIFLTKYRTTRNSREYRLLYILNTSSFKKMSLQDKITTVARLVALFEKDFRSVPEMLNKKLMRLNHELQQTLIKGFR